ncbi:MAG: hypothetical protein JWR10_2165 [Rubritepida sp.]|nr:hypothetical protein [Rubritepida sp.]
MDNIEISVNSEVRSALESAAKAAGCTVEEWITRLVRRELAGPPPTAAELEKRMVGAEDETRGGPEAIEKPRRQNDD